MRPEDYVPTPTEVGTILAASLVEGRNPEEIQENELALVRAAGVLRADYVFERFLLGACAAAYASGAYLPQKHYEPVASGFMSWFEQNAAKSETFRRALTAFRERLPIYVEAARRDQGSPVLEPDTLSITQVCYVFGDVLFSQTKSGAAAEGACRILAMVVADTCWSAQVEGSVGLFQRAGLISRPSGA